MFGRHLFRAHFHYQIKMDFLAEIFIRREKGEEDLNVKTCPKLNCGMPSRGFAYTAEHIATEVIKCLLSGKWQKNTSKIVDKIQWRSET